MIDNNDIDTRLWDHYLTYVDFDKSFEKASLEEMDEDLQENEILLTRSIVTRKHPHSN
jgi:hypothetical protein